MKLLIVYGTLLGCIGFNTANAQFKKYSNEFLSIGVGARSLAMGGAGVSSVNDVTSGYWNPAGLSDITEQPQVSFMHAEYFSGVGKYDYAGLAIPLKSKYKTLGLSFLRFGIDDIPSTIYLIEPGGRPNYNNIETFSSADYAGLISFAGKRKKETKTSLQYGASIKIIHRSVGRFAKAWGFGLDAGLKFNGPKWNFGITVRDATTTFNTWAFNFTDRDKEIFYLTNNAIPVKSNEISQPRLLLGTAFKARLGKKIKLMAELQLDNTFDGERNTLVKSGLISVDPRLGLELNVSDVFFVRGGVSNFQQALVDGDITNARKTWIFQPAVGTGFKINNLFVDYAFTNLANQSSPLYTHIVSLKVDLKKKK